MDSKPAAFVAELQNDAHAGFARCVEIGLAVPVYRTLWNEPVTFDGITYEPDELDFGEVTVEAAPTSPTMRFRIQNIRHPVTDAARPWSTVLNSENIHGRTLTVRLVSTSLLNDADALFAWEWTILRAGLPAGNYCEMELGLPVDVSRMWLPWPQIRSQRCYHEDRDGLCKNESPLGPCGKTPSDCLARHPAQAQRFSQLPHDNDLRRVD